MRRPKLISSTLALMLLLAPGVRAAEGLGEVWAVDGSASVEGRDVERGDGIAVGETVTTGEDSRLGVVAGELYVQLDPSSTVRFERGPDGRVVVVLEAGRARIVDTREDPAAAAAVTAEGGAANLAGADVEVYVLDEKAGRYAMFCTWDAPVVVARDARRLAVDPGDCALVKPGEPAYLARGHAHQIPLAGIDGPEGVYRVARGSFLAPVAAGPLLAGFPGPVAPPGLDRDPCHDPGSGCAGDTPAPGVIGIVEPPPDTGGCTAPGCVVPGLNVIEPAPQATGCSVPGCE